MIDRVHLGGAYLRYALLAVMMMVVGLVAIPDIANATGACATITTFTATPLNVQQSVQVSNDSGVTDTAFPCDPGENGISPDSNGDGNPGTFPTASAVTVNLGGAYTYTGAVPGTFSTDNVNLYYTPTSNPGVGYAINLTVYISEDGGGTYNIPETITIKVPSSGPTATQSIASKVLTQSHAATSFTPVTGSGGTAPLSYSVSPGLPPALSLNPSTGAITGTPSVTSTATTYAVTVSDANSAAATNTFSLTVNSAVTATQSVPSAVLTQNHAAISFTPVTGGGGTGSLTYSVSPSLPTGLSLNTSTGAISGTSSATSTATTYTVTVSDANSATATNTFSLTVNSAVTASQSVPSVMLTQNHAATSFTPVSGGGGTTPLSYSVSPSLPTGLSLSTSTGAVTGTPSATSSATTYTVTVTDANSATASNTFSLTVDSVVTAAQSVASTVLTQNHAAASFTPVTGGGGTTPLSYGVSPSLPAGLSLSNSTGAVTGTPSATSSATTYTVTVTDANSATATNSFILTVDGAVTATQSVASTILTQNHAATSFTPVTGSGGTTPLTYSVSPPLPGGLSLSTTTGAITGTPSATNTATTYTVTVSDANNATATNTFSLTVNSAVTAAQSVASKVLTQNHAATSFTPVTGGGGTTPLSYSVSPSLPAGLSLSTSTGAVTGTASAASSATTYTVTVTDANNATATTSFSLTVDSAVTAALAVSSATLTANHAVTAFTPVVGSGGAGSLTYSVSPSLPAGLSLASSTGAITGTPTSASSATTYTVTVTDANNATATNSFILTVNGPLAATQAVASTLLTVNHAATAFTPVTGAGGTGSLTYSVSPGLPTGLSLSSATGTITGTPTATSAATSYTVTVTDSNNATATASFSLAVDSAVTATQSVASAVLTQNHAATSFTPVTGGGGTTPLHYSISPGLPAGLSLSTTTGAVTGTPTAASSTTTYTVTVTDANSATATNSFTLTVDGALIATQAVASTTLTANHAATAFTPVTGAGGTAPLVYSVSPSLPSGLNLAAATGAVTGTATAASAATTYTVTVTDANHATATATFALTVDGAISATQAVASTTLTANHPTTAFTPVTGAGGTAPLVYSVSPALPSGLSLASGTGAITGTPTAASAAATYRVTVTDAVNATATATFSLAVDGAVSATQAVVATTLTANHAATAFTPVAGAGGTTPLTYSVSPSLPSGLSFAPGSGVVSGTPTVASAATAYTITVTDANHATASATFGLTVAGPVAATQAIASTNLTINHAATPFTPVTGAGGAGSLTYSVAPALPTGLSLASGTGAITGTPTVASAAATYTVTVTDANSATATATFSLAVSGAVTAVQAIASTSLTQNQAATAFTPVTGSGGAAPLAFSVAPSLPAGLTMAGATGAISGTPTTASAATTYSVTVTDANHATATATFSLTVAPPAIVLAPATLPQGVVGTAYGQTIAASGGTAPYTYAVAAGALPTGLALNAATGGLSGTPTATGTFTFTISAKDAGNRTGTGAYSLTVAAPAIVAVSSSATAAPGASATVDLTANATGGPFTGAQLIALSPASAGTAVITLGDTASNSEEIVAALVSGGHYLMKFTPRVGFAGSAVATFTLSGLGGTSAPATVTFAVAPLPDPSKDAEVAGLLNAQAQEAQRFANTQISNFNDRLEKLHDGDCHEGAFGIGVSDSRYTPTSTDRLRKTNPDDQSNSATAAPLDPSTPNADDSDSAQSRREAAQKRRHGDDDDKKSCGDAANATAPFAAWTNGFVNFGKLDTGLNTSTDYVTTGLSAGLDYWFNPSFTGGFGIGYGNDKSIIGSNGTVSKATGYDVAIYGSYHPSGQTFVDGLLGFGAMQFDSNRFVTDTGDFASGSRNGQQVFGSLTSGYEFKSDQLLVSPYGRLTASWSTLDGFTETGGGVYDLHYNAQTVNSFTGGAGLRAAYKFPLSFGSITLRGRLEYSHEFSGTGTATMGYADWTGGPAFSLKTNSTGTDYLTTGLGTDISFAQNWTFAFDYRTAFGQEKIPPQMFEVKLSSSF